MRSHLEIMLIWTCAAVAVLPPLWAIAYVIQRIARRRQRQRRANLISFFDIVGAPH
jgi:hypothetical protein